SRTHIAAVPRGLLALAIRTVNGGITRPETEPIATAATPPTAETAPLPPAEHHEDMNTGTVSRLHPTE
ncbi:hypothetical protein ACFY3M_55805, partial [Streptomyces mirabilis]|uniref:hypothetical protein n=1 Tax=Streptomyces mirabilis TaxID=68239 RepID=UPI0036AD70A4